MKRAGPTTIGLAAWATSVRAAAPSKATTATRAKTRAPRQRPSAGATPAVVTERTWQFGPAPAPTTRLALDLRDVAALTVDLARAGLGPAEPAALDVTSDHATRVTISGASGAVQAILDGVPEGHAAGGVLINGAVSSGNVCVNTL